MTAKEKLLNKIKLEDKCRDFSWIQNLYRNNKLALRGTLFTEETFNQFRTAIKCTQEIHTNKWDLEVEISDYVSDENYTLNIKGVVIYFEEIELKNSNNKTHKINDLFVLINFYIDGNIKIDTLYGGRTTVSYTEWQSGYFHSHLPNGMPTRDSDSRTPPFWGNFCRGSGHINDFIAEINSDIISEETYTPFLIQILGLLSWESLEGGPHKRMSSIKVSPSSGRVFTPHPVHAFNHLQNIINELKSKKQIPDLDFTLETDGYKLIDNEKFIKFLTETVEMNDSWKRNLICLHDGQNTYYAYGQLPGYNTPPNLTKKYIFQGQEIAISIGEPPQTAQLDESQYEFHPLLKEYIKKRIEYNVNTQKIRKSTIDRYQNQNGNATESTKSDTMAM